MTVLDTASGVEKKALLRDLRKQLEDLTVDLRERATDKQFHEPLRREYNAAYDAKRTAATYETWLEGRVTQAAVGWILGCVFVRFCEDNQLIPEPYLAGPGDRQATAQARHEQFFREHPHKNDRDWIEAAFDHLATAHPTAAGLFDHAHNPLWEITPSYEAASALLKFWRRLGPDGEIVHDFSDADWNTRFLGDLYQDLSENARKTYALLQTPEFVEEFILDLTLEPAVEEFGLEPTVEIRRAGGEVERIMHGLRTIDPACGSGHFLLGIFHRLLAKWREAAPGVDDWELIRRSMESVHGCDKNPFAVSIARFRLLVAAMKAGGGQRLDAAPAFPINVATGDSLMHGRDVKGEQEDLFASAEEFTYRTEDVNEYVKSCELLTPVSYHVVVGNPPYITVKDKQENENYRERWSACHREYALSVPFVQRMFHLGTRQQAGGYIGQITANSFMKREFGKKLIEKFFPTVSLSHVIDTSGAYIPGHGTPTVVIIGRKDFAGSGTTIRAILGIRGEPSTPEKPENGHVWRAIVEQVSKPGSESEWITVNDTPSELFAKHPWSLSGGGADDLVTSLNAGAAGGQLHSKIELFGLVSITGQDEAFFLDSQATVHRSGVENSIAVISGDTVRDYIANPQAKSLWPYDKYCKPISMTMGDRWYRHLWRNRNTLQKRKRFGKPVESIKSIQWFEYRELYTSKLKTDLTIAFAEVATHNHFVLDRGGKTFTQTAPVIKLPEGASEEDHLMLLGVLNSSTACFWLKQNCYPKGGDPIGDSGARVSAESWSDRYAFNASNIARYPLPEQLPLEAGRALDSLAQELAAHEPSASVAEATPTRAELDAARAGHTRIRGRMIARQEELDWEVYQLYGLVTDTEAAELRADPDTVPELNLGERAFEIALARKMAAGEAETAWFDRHGSTPITEIPAHWPEPYRQVVAKRIETIEKRRDIALIERPECKRRWSAEPWEKKEREALETWLLDRCEDRDLWFAMRDHFTQPRTLTVNQLAELMRKDPDFTSVAELYASDHLDKPNWSLAKILEQLIADQHVPYLAAMRYKDTGLRKRDQWEDVWEQQREEDRTGQRLDIPVPPKYKSTDFRKTSYWTHRGKLDVPKERFISYPEANPDADNTLQLGWAGWDHADQAQALVNLVNDRTEQAGWGADKITPLLAGLAELMPWVHQWHGEYDEQWGGNPAEEYQAFLDEQRAKHQLSTEALRAWRPAPTTRGRKKK
ncbi:BREX-2 system adenine-specific DNA-methyltransferase PglX [Haloechinothrix salitolerans]